MVALLLVALLVWVVLIVLGVVIKGLFWLVIVGAVLIAITAVLNVVRRRSVAGKR
jgi:hypothetical protein